MEPPCGYFPSSKGNSGGMYTVGNWWNACMGSVTHGGEGCYHRQGQIEASKAPLLIGSE